MFNIFLCLSVWWVDPNQQLSTNPDTHSVPPQGDGGQNQKSKSEKNHVIPDKDIFISQGKGRNYK